VLDQSGLAAGAAASRLGPKSDHNAVTVNIRVARLGALSGRSEKSLVGGVLRHPAVLNSPPPVSNFYSAAR
jgi:hypothetical protein